jgi:hypothetical protein
VVEGLNDVNPLLRVEREHLAQEVDGLVSGAWRQRVQTGDRGRLEAPTEDVSFSSVASELHFVHGGRAQEISDKFKLLNRTLRLK